jgi:hypothetical protein
MMRAPVMPNGWPGVMAPPRRLRISPRLRKRSGSSSHGIHTPGRASNQMIHPKEV